MKTFLDWSSYKNSGVGDAYADIPKNGGDFAKAVAVCISSRLCEKKEKGVMCPSYRISDNPLLSTGGRVKLLKSVLNNNTPLSLINGAQLATAMDMCIGCKGCKRECENEVDMAMIKVEYLAQRHTTSPVPLRTRIFAYLPDLLSRVPLMAFFITWRNHSRTLARVMHKLIGISSERTIPVPVSTPFSIPKLPSVHEPSSDEIPEHKRVVLFVDTFTRRFEHQNAHAAISVLKNAGYEVIIAGSPGERNRSLCCGRTKIAHGLIEEAKKSARQVIDALLPYAQQGINIIGLEPACLLAIRDDYRFLGLGKSAENVANHTLLFEEFVAREYTAGRLKLDLKPLPADNEPTLVHGHCHQKAVGAMKSMRKLLKLIPDFEFKLVESSCCGMAGSFGLEKEHMQSSLAMAELALAPVIRKNPDARIVANGFSCRHQITETTNRESIHIAQLLHMALAETSPLHDCGA